MKIFKFEIEWRQEKWEVRGDDTNRLDSVARMKGVVNIVSNSEELARLVFEQHWKYYPWLEYKIVKLVSAEPVYMSAILQSTGSGVGGVNEVAIKEHLPLSAK